MFVREKRNKSGVVSVQIIDKSGGRYRVVKTIGSSADLSLVADFVSSGRRYIKELRGASFGAVSPCVSEKQVEDNGVPVPI
jgi:hypothetical protein